MALKNLKLVYRFLGKEVRKLFLYVILLGGVTYLLELSFVYILQSFLSAIGAVKAETPAIFGPALGSLTVTLSLMLGYGVFKFIFSMMKGYLSNVIGIVFINEKRYQLLKSVLSDGQTIHSAKIINVFTERLTLFADFLSHISNFIVSSILIVAMTITGFYISFREFFLCIALLSILILPLLIFNKNIKVLGVELNNYSFRLIDKVVQNLRNFFLIKVYNLNDIELKHTKDLLDSYKRHFKSYYRLIALKQNLPPMLGILIITIVTFISIRYFNTSGMTLISVYYIFLRIANAAGEINAVVGNFQLSMANFEAIYPFFKEQTEVKAPAIPKASLASVDRIRLKNVSFQYPASPFLFRDLDFELKRGDVLVIKGVSGKGKSTLSSLILGLLEPTQGEVTYNDRNIWREHLSLAEVLGYVGPESYLIPGSLRDNLLYASHGKSLTTDSDIHSVLAKARLTSLVEGLEGSLDYRLDEHAQISTGQKQRMAIARALLRKPQVLVLDEATANLDFDTEAEIIESLGGLKKDLITIIITHKNSFDSIATRQISL